MINSTHRRPPRKLQQGFSIIEILVGAAIALLASIVVMQIASTFEGQKRTTSGNADAQSNAAIALYAVSRGIQVAGFGLPLFSALYHPLHCAPPPTVLDPAGTPHPLFPVTIVDGVPAGAPDGLILHGVKVEGGNAAESLGGIPLVVTTGMTVPGGVVTFANNMACRANDRVIATPRNSSNCMSARVAAVNGTTQLTLDQIVPGAGGYAAPAANDGVICLPNWIMTNYAIAGNQLTELSPPNVPVATPVASDIVNMQLQYGVAAAATPTAPGVAAWVDATGPWDAAAITPASRRLIRAVRIAVIARNGVQESIANPNAINCTTLNGPITPASGVCAWEGTGPNPAPAVTITNLPNSNFYRYRVMETIVPLRNMVLNSVQLCAAPPCPTPPPPAP